MMKAAENRSFLPLPMGLRDPCPHRFWLFTYPHAHTHPLTHMHARMHAHTRSKVWIEAIRSKG